MDYFAGIFTALGLTWIQRKNEHHNFGGLNCELLYDGWGVTMNAKDNLAIKTHITNWNDPNYQNEDEAFPKERHLITDYKTLYESIDLLPIDHKIRIKAFAYVPIDEIKNYLQKDLSAAKVTGSVEAARVIDKERSKKENSLLMWYLLGVFIAGMGVMALITKFM